MSQQTWGDRPANMPGIPEDAKIGIILGVLGCIFVFLGLSMNFYSTFGTGWELAQDGNFWYIYIIPIFGIIGLVSSVLILFVREDTFWILIDISGILVITLSIIALLHGYAYYANIGSVSFREAVNTMGVGFGWFFASIGGAMMIFGADRFRVSAITNDSQRESYKSPAQQPYPIIPPQNPEGKFCQYCGVMNPVHYHYCGRCQQPLPPKR